MSTGIGCDGRFRRSNMLATLQWYILREMGKTFLLTAVALTVVLGLGGGVMNLVELEQVSPSQLLRLMVLVLPVAGTLTLPVAALYSATATFGRLSADNEFLACRSAGINILRLFLAPAMIALVSATCTFCFINFVIPGLVRDLNNLARADVRQFIEQRVRSPGRLALPGGKVRIYADALGPSPVDEESVVLLGVAYLEVEGQTWRRYGTAKSISLRFSNQDGEPTITGSLNEVSYYDQKRKQWASAGHLDIPANTIPRRIRLKVKWLNLGELLRYRAHPESWPKVAESLDLLRAAITSEKYYAEVFEDCRADGQVTFTTATGRITLQAARGTQDAHDGRPTFEEVILREVGDGLTRTITATAAVLLVEAGDGEAPLQAVLQVSGNVAIESEQDDGTIRKGRERLGGIRISPNVVSQVQELTDEALLEGRALPQMRPAVTELRARLAASAAKFVRELTSELNSRIAFSVSALVLVLLGAALGIIFKGSQLLVAFGISFVPSLLVTVMNIMGRQLAENAPTVTLGLCVIWGAIVLVAALDVWALRRVIRR